MYAVSPADFGYTRNDIPQEQGAFKHMISRNLLGF